MLDLQANKKIMDQAIKLTTRAEKITMTEGQFFEYLIKTQKLHIKFSQTFRSEAQTLQDSLQNKSYYSSDRLNLMKAFYKIENTFFSFIEKVSMANTAELTKIQSKNMKCSDKSNKCDNFMKSLNQYYNDSKNYNKKYGEYETNVTKLQQMIQKYKQLQDPVNFYNPNKSTDKTKNIQQNFQQCETAEAGLINNLQLLQQKRKLLGQNIKTIRQQYIVFIQERIQHIMEGVYCMTDSKKDDLYASHKITFVNNKNLQNNVDFPQIIQVRPNNKSIAYQDDGLLTQIETICANGRASFTGYKSELKILEDRCKVFRNKIYDTTQQYTNFQKSFLQEIIQQVSLCQKNQKQFDNIYKQVFRANGSSNSLQDTYFDKFSKYFGNSLYKIMTLCFLITDKPLKCISNIKKIFLQNEDKLRTMINQKQDQFKRFKKKLQLIKTQAKNDFKSQFNNSSLEENNRTLTKNLQNFKNMVQQFLLIQRKIDHQFNMSINAMIQIIKQQIKQLKLNNIINQQQKAVEALNQWNSDAQIVNLMKDDRKYDILFQSQQLNGKTKFKSLLGKKKCQKTKNVLMQKNIRRSHNQSQVIKRSSCCGGLAKKKNLESLFDVYVIKNLNKKNQGKLLITQKQMNFMENKLNPFVQKLQFSIPSKQIKSYERLRNQNKQEIKINTFMGPIYFLSNQLDLLQQSLKNDLGIDQNFDEKIMTKKEIQPKIGKKISELQQKIDIRMDSRIYQKLFSKSDSRQNKSTEIQAFPGKSGGTILQKIIYEGTANPGNKVGSNKIIAKKVNDDAILANLFMQIKNTKYFSQNLKIVNQSNPNQFQYRLQHQYYKCSIFQKRIPQINQYQKLLTIQFFWKISFPEYPILRSFIHSEYVKIQLKQTSVKINIKQKTRKQTYLESKKKFYEEVDRMNLSLSNYIVQFCIREGEVVLQQEPLEESFMKSEVSFNQEAKFSVNSRDDYSKKSQLI